MRIIMYCHNIIWYYSRASSFLSSYVFLFLHSHCLSLPLLSIPHFSLLAFSSFYSHIFFRIFSNSFGTSLSSLPVINFGVWILILFHSNSRRNKKKRYISTEYSVKKLKKSHSWNILYRFRKVTRKKVYGWNERNAERMYIALKKFAW